MKSYNIKQAREHFEDIVAQVEAGNEVIITRWTTPVAKLVAHKAAHLPEADIGKRKFGALRHKMTRRSP